MRFFFPHNSENGYGIRVSGTAVSQHWGKVLLSSFSSLSWQLLFYHLFVACICNV